MQYLYTKNLVAGRCNITYKKDEQFFTYLFEKVLNEKSKELIREVSSVNDVLIFSGVIRDYWLKRNKPARDLDFVIDEGEEGDIFVGHCFESRNAKINSFGGYKLLLDNLFVDVWTLKDTWGIVHEKKDPNVIELVSSAFFNFSAIAYSIKQHRFVIHKAFRDFLDTKEIDVLYDKNPNIPLCIVNSFYYSKELNLSLSPRLKQWIQNNYQPDYDYSGEQERHWGEIKYSNEVIRNYIGALFPCSSVVWVNEHVYQAELF